MAKRKIVLRTTTGHIVRVYSPNDDSTKMVDEVATERNWTCISSEVINDNDVYFEEKFRTRVDDFENAVVAYRSVVENEGVFDNDEVQRYVQDALLTAIETYISVLLGMVRRIELHHMNIDYSRFKELMNDWEREVY